MFVIDSPGGYVSHGMRLVKAIERSPKKVACVVDGLAASMAAVVLQACTFRAATERSVIMFHGAGVGGDFEGQEHDFRNMAERLRVLNEALNRYTCRRLTVEYAVCAAWTAAGLEKWMTPRDAIDVGALDAVIPFLPAGT
jgi:ATP-dependent protease ClpP protease subunit